MMMTWMVSIIATYIVGAIPFGVLIGRLHGIDIREHGSRNIGATNVGRVLGRGPGLVCFILDFFKGAGPVIFAGAINGVLGRDANELSVLQMWLWMSVAAAAVVGHMFSVFLGFKGGKGVATAFGSLAGMWPLLTLPAIGALVVWYAALRFTRYVSVASMLGAASIPAWYVISLSPSGEATAGHQSTGKLWLDSIVHGSPPLIVTALLAGLVIFKHRSNIGRLARGEEPRAGGSARRGDVLDQAHDQQQLP